MLFISMEDFFAQAGAVKALDQAEEKALAQRMTAGDKAAREALIRGYLPFVAAKIRQAPENIRTLRTVYACIQRLEKSVDSFHSLEDRSFIHHLSWGMRQCITRCIADQV